GEGSWLAAACSGEPPGSPRRAGTSSSRPTGRSAAAATQGAWSRGPPGRGCLEQVASGQAIGRLGREAATDRPQSLIAELADHAPIHVTGQTVTRAAKAGDDVAIRILSQVGRRLGEGIAGLVNVLDPQIVVIGGGAAEGGELFIPPAGERCEHRPGVPLVAAQLGNDAGAVGAAVLALEELGGWGAEGGRAGSTKLRPVR